jgi:hypothetical protein
MELLSCILSRPVIERIEACRVHILTHSDFGPVYGLSLFTSSFCSCHSDHFLGTTTSTELSSEISGMT